MKAVKQSVWISVCCVLLALCLVLGTLLALSYTGKRSDDTPTEPLYATTGSDNIQFRLSLLHLYYESEMLVSTLPFTTVNITTSALTKALASGSGSTAAAVAYLNSYVDGTLATAYSQMNSILAKYKSILSTYAISSSSTYTAKYNALSGYFTRLKSSSDELTKRTRSLISVVNTSNYDSYYTAYSEQLNDLATKITTYSDAINAEYEALLQAISEDYAKIK